VRAQTGISQIRVTKICAQPGSANIRRTADQAQSGRGRIQRSKDTIVISSLVRNGGFEFAGTDPVTDPFTFWTEYYATASGVMQYAGDKHQGNYSAHFKNSGSLNK
jgi:hypothetical protein